MVVTDFATLAGGAVADDLSLPLVINLPGPLSLLRAMCGMVDARPIMILFPLDSSLFLKLFQKRFRSASNSI